ncbi:hypothetical protein A1Q1_06085 [Trichosporon asahii var. asahii CBS 2479]|uniref:Mediator complex subunit 11 n=1 Tax=Trichosporon asahii var. asahii (strain ATCC 90039 / CBS 2479 / JCM 2466 / KCTC 7840 / NBRC 103889/ NCYC 2677 / UAMH 7654) TaxID=1186058 RepID=J6EMC5_TRIAS|nr:hypothetical protein A1Q1_06085 [Trichosporon asahii var. asahii CBS 2479]EJT45469.1 hypothetical protein A1Q1_06085 [Trichosporon asahii var. asahii CBS 2479]
MSESDPLELTSLDTESLLTALLNAEKAIPSLLQDVKPVLTHLKESDPSEEVGTAAKEAVDRYMNTLDFILRQTVYFLRETRSAPNAMRPSPVDGIPRPFAALRGEEVGLGLYGLRVERDTLQLLQQSVESMREQSLRLGEEKKPEDKGEDGEVDHPME